MAYKIVKTKKNGYYCRTAMEIYLHNTLTRAKEKFTPLEAGKVTMYNCGPTVYDTPHIGNYRTFVMYDLIRRLFEYNGYEVIQAMNITDVDDKTLRRSREQNVSLKEITEKYEKIFLEGIELLNILRPTYLLRATEHIEDMIHLISVLLEKGIAYKTDDGVYIHINKVKDYGALANLKPDSVSRERIANDEYDKDNPHDFAVWKFRIADDGETSWQAPFGEGRPGWHIECSAMAMKTLGETIDIHTGGNDLIFPHHTNEIAQSESATGRQFSRYWVHGGFITLNNEKMAKSKGAVSKLEDLEAAAISPLSYRYWLLTAHYRSLVNFSIEALEAAQNALVRLTAAMGNYPAGGTVIPDYQKRFQQFINDDLNLPQAVALAWELIKDPAQSEADKKATIVNFDSVFGLKLSSAPQLSDEGEQSDIPAEIQALVDAREEARKAKDWVKADALRAEIESRGFVVKDTNKGVKIIAD